MEIFSIDTFQYWNLVIYNSSLYFNLHCFYSTERSWWNDHP